MNAKFGSERATYDSSSLDDCSLLQYCGVFSATCVRSDSMTSPTL